MGRCDALRSRVLTQGLRTCRGGDRGGLQGAPGSRAEHLERPEMGCRGGSTPDSPLSEWQVCMAVQVYRLDSGGAPSPADPGCPSGRSLHISELHSGLGEPPTCGASRGMRGSWVVLSTRQALDDEAVAFKRSP